MKIGPTMFLRAAVILIGLPVLVLCIYLLPQVVAEFHKNQTTLDYLFYAIFFIMYLTAVPFFFALHQAMKILKLIDKQQAFTKKSLRALRNIKNSALLITLFYMIGVPVIYLAAEQDDAPGLILIGMFIVFVSFVIATLAALVHRLFETAIEIKSENDLTV